jgi:integrase
MPRARTGTLIPPGADGLWRARITKTLPDGTSDRPLYALGTSDKALARRKLARLVASTERGEDILDAQGSSSASERVRDYADAWLVKREAQGVGMAKKERRSLELYALEAIGRLPLGDVRASHVRSILDDAASQGRKRATVAHVRGALHRLFAAALADESIEQNPVTAVRMPRMREVRKERAILTDVEFAAFVGCSDVDLELRMLALVARCEGGMRTGDLHRWDWTQLDRVHFAECIIPRAKTGLPQVLAIPPALAPFLRAWWERAGSPESGPVFPTRRGTRAGQAKRPLNSYAKRLRRELVRAGVRRMTPIEVPATASGMRTDLGQRPEGTKLAPHPKDPLYYETATTLPVDFHSFRRAFNTALAEAGVNVQHAMHLAAHADPKTHMRYVMNTTAMRTIPDAALPRLPVGQLVEASGRGDAPRAANEASGEVARGAHRIVTARDNSRFAATESGAENVQTAHRIVTARDDSTEMPLAAPRAVRATARLPQGISAPTAGLEPATRRLTAACSTN